MARRASKKKSGSGIDFKNCPPMYKGRAGSGMALPQAHASRERDLIQSAIRHIDTAVDVDPWAKEAAEEAMRAKLGYMNTHICNGCRHYEGTHYAMGHGPCSFWGISGVLHDDYCSRWEKHTDEQEEMRDDAGQDRSGDKAD